MPLRHNPTAVSSFKCCQHEQGVTTLSANAADLSISLQIADDHREHCIGGINAKLYSELVQIKASVLAERIQYRLV